MLEELKLELHDEPWQSELSINYEFSVFISNALEKLFSLPPHGHIRIIGFKSKGDAFYLASKARAFKYRIQAKRKGYKLSIHSMIHKEPFIVIICKYPLPYYPLDPVIYPELSDINADIPFCGYDFYQ